MSRIKVYFKRIRGVHFQPAKESWEFLEKMLEENSTDREAVFEVGVVQGWVNGIDRTLKEEADELHNSLVDFITENKDEIIKFAKAYGCDVPGSSSRADESDPVLFTGAELRTKVLKVFVCYLGKAADMHSEIFTDHNNLTTEEDLTDSEGDKEDVPVPVEDIEQDDKHCRLIVSHHLLEILQAFGGEYEPLIQELFVRMGFHNDACAALVTSSTVSRSLITWSGLYQRDMQIKKVVHIIDARDSIGGKLVLLNASAAGPRIVEHIKRFVLSRIASGGSVAAAIIQELTDLTMPPAVDDIVRAARTIQLLMDTSGKIKDGKGAVGLSELCSLISETFAATKLITRAVIKQKNLTNALEAVSTWFKGMLTLHLQRFVQATEIVVLFDNHFRDLPAAVEAWDFTSCKWLARGAEDSNRVSVSKDLSKMAPQFDVWEMSLKRVSETMDWLPQAEKSEVADSIAGLAELKKKVEYSTRLLATSILADKVLTIARSEAIDEDDVLKAPSNM